MSDPRTPLTPTLSPLAQGEGATPRTPRTPPLAQGEGAPVWRGSVLASGFVLDETLMERAELVKRLLGAWTDRARLGRDGTRWFLLGTTPRQVDSRMSIGAPLVLVQGRWLTGPATPEVVRVAPMDSILDCVAGERKVISFSSLTSVHPSELVELELPTLLEVQLLAPPPPPVVPKRAPAPTTLDTVFAPMLAALGPSRLPEENAIQRPPPPTLRQRIGAWLTARQQAAAARPRGPSLGSRLGSFFSALANRLPSLPSGGSPPRQLGPGRERTVREIRERPPTPRGPSWFDRFASWFTPGPGTGAPPNEPMQPLDPGLLAQLAQWFSANAAQAPPPRDPPPRPRVEGPGWLARTFRNLFSSKDEPKKQQAYLEDLRRRFLLGDLGEALRRAIPLGGAGFGAPTGGVPVRRDTLSLFSPSSVGAPSMIMQNDEYAEMRKLYRESADKLIAEGKIEEAAYVLAKLLNDGAAAVALLEKHGKLELAAQLATAQHLPEVERIRLWLLAGKKEEAIRIARGNNDFSVLVQTLTTRSPELARQLRGVWGEFLAERQRYTEAIAATAPLSDAPPQWDEWVNRSLEAGGANAATALAVDASRHPENSQQTRERVGALLVGDERAPLTIAAAEAFLKHAPAAKNGPLFRELWRKLMRGASGGHRVDRGLADRVMRAAADPTLVLDAVAAAPLPAQGVREPLELPAPVVPGLPVFDVAPLPKGRRAIALGAAGLRITSPSGETIRHHLVKSSRSTESSRACGSSIRARSSSPAGSRRESRRCHAATTASAGRWAWIPRWCSSTRAHRARWNGGACRTSRAASSTRTGRG